MMLCVRKGYRVEIMEELCIDYGQVYLAAQGPDWCKCSDCKRELE